MVKQAVFNRLYADGQKELKKREKVYEENKSIISSECTFSPTLSPVKGSANLGDDEGTKIDILKGLEVTLSVEDFLNALVSTVEEVSGTINNTSQEADDNSALSRKLCIDKYNLKLDKIYARKEEDVQDEIQLLQQIKKQKSAKKKAQRSSRFKHLYQEAASRRHRRDKAHYEKAQVLPQECTFEPTIYTRKNRRNKKNRNSIDAKDRSKEKVPETADQIFARVLKRNQDYADKRRKHLRQSLRKKPHGCTFMPQVNRKKSQGNNKIDAARTCLSLYQRGEKERKLRNEQIQHAKLERDIRRKIETTSVWGSPIVDIDSAMASLKANPNALINFNPSPPKKSEKKSTSSVSRAGKVTMARNASKSNPKSLTELSKVVNNMDIEKKKKGQDIQCTFRPAINNRSAKLINGKKDGKSIYQRLYKEGKDHFKRSLSRETSNPTGCTFKPSLRISKSSNNPKSNKVDRFLSLYKDSEARLDRRDKAHSKIPSQCTFQPDISASNDNGMGENADR